MRARSAWSQRISEVAVVIASPWCWAASAPLVRAGGARSMVELFLPRGAEPVLRLDAAQGPRATSARREGSAGPPESGGKTIARSTVAFEPSRSAHL